MRLRLLLTLSRARARIRTPTQTLTLTLTIALTLLQEFVSSHVKDGLQLASLKKLPTLRWRKQEKEKGD